MTITACVRRRSAYSGGLLCGHPFRTYVKHYHGTSGVRWIQVCVPGLLINIRYWGEFAR